MEKIAKKRIKKIDKTEFWAIHGDVSTKKTMTLNLTPQEMAVLEYLASKKELTKTGVIKLAIRLLQTLDARIEPGKKLMVEDETTKEKSELVIL
jgi:hypothetical protein